MRRLVCAVALFTLGACTTVSIGADPEANAPDQTGMSEFQMELRGAARALQSDAKDGGWSPMSGDESLQRALAVLLHGRDKAADNHKSDPVEVYLEARTRPVPADTFQAVLSDLEAAAVGARRVNAAATAVIIEGSADSATLGEDVQAVERSIGVVRRARSLIGDAIGRFAGRVDEPQPIALAQQLEALDTELGRMSELADALNSLRLSTVREPDLAVIG